MRNANLVINRPDALDPALRRPGRLDRELEIRAPTVAERKDILNILLKKIPHRLDTKEVDRLASITHGFVGADLSLLVAEASLAAAKRIISGPSPGNLIQARNFPACICILISILFQNLQPMYLYWLKIPNKLCI